jgi:hypothetical protein
MAVVMAVGVKATAEWEVLGLETWGSKRRRGVLELFPKLLYGGEGTLGSESGD